MVLDRLGEPRILASKLTFYSFDNTILNMSLEIANVVRPHVETGEQLHLNRQIINFMGPEGSGKTTIAKRLAAESARPRIVFGDVFRDLAVNDPGPYGDECRAVFSEHRYIRPQILFEIMVQRFKQEDLADGFIIDGALRAVEEVQGFQAMLDEAGRSMLVTNIFLRVPGWMGIDRILKNAKNDRNRTDDNPDAILSRLSHFYHDLGKRVSLIEKQPDWKLLHVDGTGTIDETYGKVLTALA